MKILFNVEYQTTFGEDLVLNILSDEASKTSKHKMTTLDGTHWFVELTKNLKPGTYIDYYYSLMRGDEEARHEWLVEPHRLEFAAEKGIRYTVYDHWIDIPEDAYLYSSAFTDCVMANQRELSTTTEYLRTVRLKVRAPQLRIGEQLGIVGAGDALGNWDVNQALPMFEHEYHEWVISLDAASLPQTFEFKFVMLGIDEPVWEECGNRTVALTEIADNEVIVYELSQANFPLYPWKGAGTVIPIFSLRSEGSFGVGDFGDLKLMIEWADKTNQRVLQVLPINDTNMTHTWQDSYPYNSISIYALHPQYTDLRQLPEIKDEKQRTHFEQLRQELNALPQIDYERMFSAKLEYLQVLFAQEGAAVKRTAAYKQFCQDNEQWLKPYTEFCYYRDLYGTAEFPTWPKTLPKPDKKVTDFWCYVQYNLDRQMHAAHKYAREHRVILKGDIPIGISRDGVEAWVEPKYFNLNFDAYRIDHVLGFFRIWEIPVPEKSGLEGQFAPALGLSREEIEGYGIYGHDDLFLVDHKRKDRWHPRIAVQYQAPYEKLNEGEKANFNRLYNDYFYRRNNQFWYQEAMKKLPRLTQATRMLCCAEDLGMVPDCVPWVMNELRILSLEIQSMPKDDKVRFGHLSRNPYRSVCTISTHDMPTLRQWWDEDEERTQAYYNTMLYRGGAAPHPLPGWLAKDIVSRHLTSPSMLCLLSLQDWLSIDERLRLPDQNAERINIPANPRHYWRYRMHLTIEQLLREDDFNETVKTLILQSGRK